MKWCEKYKVDLDAIYQKHLQGYSLPELSEEFKIPRTTIARYFDNAGLITYNNRHRARIANLKRQLVMPDIKWVYKNSATWKRALLQIYPYQCQIKNCGYTLFVEAHHIVPAVDGGQMTLPNGCLLCPNHHAEAHAGLVDIKALSKRGELLGSLEKDNQQPSCVSNETVRDTEGSETRDQAKAVLSPRAPRIVGVPEYLKIRNDDIVRTVGKIKQQRVG